MTQSSRHAAAANHVLVIWHQHSTASYTTWRHTMGPVMFINVKTHIYSPAAQYLLFSDSLSHMTTEEGTEGGGWEEVRRWECVTSPVFHTHRKQGWQTGKCHSRAGRLWQNSCHNSNQSTGWEQRVGWKRQEFNYNSTLHTHVGTQRFHWTNCPVGLFFAIAECNYMHTSISYFWRCQIIRVVM